jgi:hypothetical protein
MAMRKKIENIQRYLDTRGDLKIRLVCYADPPIASIPSVREGRAALPHVVLPEYWSLPRALKKALESPITHDVALKQSVGKCIASSWDPKGGVIMLVETELNQLLRASYYYTEVTPAIKFGALCACVKAHMVRRNYVFHMKEAEPFGFITQDSSGCNPGGYSYYPGSENFNRAMLRHMGDKLIESKAPLITDEIVRKHFPRHKFDNNEMLADLYSQYKG